MQAQASYRAKRGRLAAKCDAAAQRGQARKDRSTYVGLRRGFGEFVARAGLAGLQQSPPHLHLEMLPVRSVCREAAAGQQRIPERQRTSKGYWWQLYLARCRRRCWSRPCAPSEIQESYLVEWRSTVGATAPPCECMSCSTGSVE